MRGRLQHEPWSSRPAGCQMDPSQRAARWDTQGLRPPAATPSLPQSPPPGPRVDRRPPGPQRAMRRGAELSVFQGRSPSRGPPPSPPAPGSPSLRKQKSLTNLSPGPHQPGNPRTQEGKDDEEEEEEGGRKSGARARSLSLSLGGRLVMGEPTGQRSSRTEKAKAQDAGDEILGPGARFWAEEEEEGGYLREGAAHLDREVILTMLGHLEQALDPHRTPGTCLVRFPLSAALMMHLPLLTVCFRVGFLECFFFQNFKTVFWNAAFNYQ